MEGRVGVQSKLPRGYLRCSLDIIKGEPEWEVEQIMGARCFGQSRQLQYQVKWVGYSNAHDIWETADGVHAPQLTVDFWKGNQALAQEIAYMSLDR